MKRASVVLGLLACAGIWAACAGGHSVALNAAPSNPAAMAKVSVGKDSNGNTTVDLKAQHLANPSNLTPARQVYVVWIQPNGRPPENKGQMAVDKNLNSEFKTVTPYQHFDIFVTAEDAPNVASPSGQEVLRNTVNR